MADMTLQSIIHSRLGPPECISARGYTMILLQHFIPNTALRASSQVIASPYTRGTSMSFQFHQCSNLGAGFEI